MAYGIYTSASFLNSAGIANIAASSTVEVRRESDNGIATIFADVNGSTPLANPFSADTDGQFSLYAAGIARGYKVTVTKGANVRILRNVPISTGNEFDISDFMGALLTATNGTAFLAGLGSVASQPAGSDYERARRRMRLFAATNLV